MKVFVIPSWYPTKSNPSYGIFNQEQLFFLANRRAQWNFGISTWGQGESAKLLWARDHFLNLIKIREHLKDKGGKSKISENVTEYYEPALSWTKKFRKGNLKALIEASEKNLESYALENGKPNVIWVQSTYPGAFIGKHLSDKYDVPFVITIHFGGYLFENLLRDLGSRKKEFLEIINAASKVVCVSEFQKNELKSMIPHAEVLHNPIDTEFFKVGETDNGKILAIGRLEEQKAFDLLIYSMKSVPNAKLRIIGNGSLLSQFQKQIATLGLEERVELAGELNREEVASELRKCSFLALSSIHETFGICLVEALASGKPVVATKCGGPEEIVTEELGYLCEMDSSDLAEKINLMIKYRDAFDAKKIGAEAARRFSPEKWADQMEQLFRSATAK